MRQLAQFFAKPLLAVALLGAFTAPAFAQQGAAPADQVSMLKNELKITSAQEGAFKKYLDVMAIAPQPSQTMDENQYNAMTTPERIAFQKKMRQEETSFIFNRFDAAQALYSALDDSQKKIFDEMTALRAPQQAPAKAPAKKK